MTGLILFEKQDQADRGRYIAAEIFGERVYDGILPLGMNSPRILDLGANIGAAAVWFMEQHSGARVFSVEPDRDNFAILDFNVIGSPCGCIKAAVWKKLAYLAMISPPYDSRPCALMTIEQWNGPVLGLPIQAIVEISDFEHIDLTSATHYFGK
jgi:hypothetical protein